MQGTMAAVQQGWEAGMGQLAAQLSGRDVQGVSGKSRGVGEMCVEVRVMRRCVRDDKPAEPCLRLCQC